MVPPLRVRGDWPTAVCGAAATGRDGIARHRRAYCGQPFRTTGRRHRAGRVALHRMGRQPAEKADGPDADGRGVLRVADRVRERRQSAPLARGAPVARNLHQGRPGRQPLAHRASASDRERPAQHVGRGRRPRPHPDLHSSVRRGDSAHGHPVLGRLVDGCDIVRVPAGHLRHVRSPVRSRAGAADLQDQRHRGIEGNRTPGDRWESYPAPDSRTRRGGDQPDVRPDGGRGSPRSEFVHLADRGPGISNRQSAHHDRAARRAEVSGERGSRGIHGSAHRTSRLAARSRVVHDRISASCEWRRADVSAPGRPRDCQCRGHAATHRNQRSSGPDTLQRLD